MTKTSVTRTNKERKLKLKLLRGEKLYIGMDVHKHSYSVAFYGDKQGLVDTFVMDAKPYCAAKYFASFRKKIVRIVYEAGPTGYALVRVLREAGFTAEVIVTGKIPRPSTKETKTDRIDCRKLAEYAAKDMLHYVHVPDEQRDADRQLMRLRGQAMQSVQKIKTRIKSFLLYNTFDEPEGLERWSHASVLALRNLKLPPLLKFNLDSRLNELSFAESHLKSIKLEIQSLEKTDRYRVASSHLRMIPGIGLLTSMTVLTELIAPHRYRNEREVAKMAGLSPRISQSGEMRRDCGLSSAGNRRLRHFLIEAAWRWKAQDSRALARYDQLRKNTGSSQKAIVGVARKLMVIMWRMVTRNEGYHAAA